MVFGSRPNPSIILRPGASPTKFAPEPKRNNSVTTNSFGTLGTLEYDHGDGISITGGLVYRGIAIPELFGKYVFGDLALRNAPPRVDGRLFYANLDTGVIEEFLLPQFAGGILPDGLTVHGFGVLHFIWIRHAILQTPPFGVPAHR